MLEEKEQELHENAEDKESGTTEKVEVSEKIPEIELKDETTPTEEIVEEEVSEPTDPKEGVLEKIDAEKVEVSEKIPKIEPKYETTPTQEIVEEEVSEPTGPKEDVLEEIDEENAEDAEDADNHHRHQIAILDYHAMSIENLVGELQRLVRNEKVQAIKKHVDGIKYEFELKFQEFLEQKKEDFISKGGNEIDFKYNSVTKRQFNEVYSDYREKRNHYYKSLEKSHKDNLAIRLEIIEELKGLVNVEEDINTTYKNFKDIQERWRNAGPVPRNHYNDVWRTYQHHIEIFYDFLHLNRELRDLDFKHNLEEKTKIAEQAETLANEENLDKAFRELQTLHKIWKEDIGPVDKEHRDAIWDRFSNATKILHKRRQDYFNDLEKVYEQNLVKKEGVIASINEIAQNVAEDHKTLQQQISKIEELRDQFFKTGKVPQKVNEKTWVSFKTAVRAFNRNKNSYYKNLKNDQQENLDKKRELLNLALSLKDSEDWATTTQEFKRIQGEWKKVGHVPRKFSDKIWKDFKNACNHYFDRLHALKDNAHKEESENLDKKNDCLERLKAFELSGKRDKDLATLKEFIEEWKNHGHVPFSKKSINQKFNKIVDALFRKLNVDRKESELIKYGDKIQELAQKDDERAIYNERTFIRRKIDESKGEIRQLENNLQFFSNASEDNPLVKEVYKKLGSHKTDLSTWKEKLKKLNILENNLNKSNAEGDESEEADSEEG